MLESTLTPAQQERLQALYDDSRQYAALGYVGFCLAGLDLSGEQKAAIQASIARYRPEIERLGAAAKLNRDEAGGQQAAQLWDRLMDEVTSVLTAQQRQALPAPKNSK